MAEFNRSGFKATSMASLTSEEKKTEAAVPQNNYQGRAGFHTISDGKNVFRIAPSPTEKEPAYRGVITSQLEVESDIYDSDNQKTGKKELKSRKIFIATQHSAGMKEDPILLYIDHVLKRANDEYSNKDERIKFLQPLKGWRGKDGKWNWGIEPMTSYVCYAWDKEGKLGRLELRDKWYSEMKRLSVENNDDNVAIVVDVFTDPDQGYPLVLTEFLTDKGKKDYRVSCDTLLRGETWEMFFERTRVTDNQLMELSQKESLTDLYYDVYTSRDFNLALDGLRRFDEKYKYGIFENEDFIDKLEALKKTVPAEKKEADNPFIAPKEEPKKTTSSPRVSEKANPMQEIEEDIKQEVQEKLGNMTPIPKMKTLIKQYIVENYGDDYSLPTHLTNDQIKEWYALCKVGDELPFDTLDAPQEDLPVETVKEPVVDKSESTEDDELKAQIDKLRSRRRPA